MQPSLILACIGAYFVVLLIIAHFTSGDGGDKSFFIGEKKSPWYLVAFGMIGASLSGVTFISVPGVVGNLESVNGQFSYMQMVFGYVVGYAFIALVLMPVYYRLNLTSIYTYLEDRFGITAYKTGAFFFIFSRTIGASFRLFLVAIVLQRFVFDPWNVPFYVTVFITLALIWTYTFRGGIKTIVWTDSLQTLFMLLSVGLTLYIIASRLNLDLGGVIETIKASNYSQMFFFDDGTKGEFFFKQFISGAFIAIAMTGLDQDMMQKNNSCKNIKEAQLNMFSFSIVLVVVNLLFVSLGALLHIYAEQQGIAKPDRTDYLFPELAISHFSPMVGIIFLIGLVAAAYSSADSALTALTTSFCVDFLGFEKPENTLDEQQRRKQRYLTHIGFTFLLFVVIVIFYYVIEQDVISGLFKIAGYTYGPLLGLFAFGLFTKWQIHDRYALIPCLLAPILSYLINIMAPKWFPGYEFGFEILVINGILTFVGLLLIKKNKHYANA